MSEVRILLGLEEKHISLLEKEKKKWKRRLATRKADVNSCSFCLACENECNKCPIYEPGPHICCSEFKRYYKNIDIESSEEVKSIDVIIQIIDESLEYLYRMKGDI